MDQALRRGYQRTTPYETACRVRHSQWLGTSPREILLGSLAEMWSHARKWSQTILTSQHPLHQARLFRVTRRPVWASLMAWSSVPIHHISTTSDTPTCPIFFISGYDALCVPFFPIYS